MDLYLLQKIVIQLLAVIATSASVDVENQPPTISFVPHTALEQRLCGRPCPVYAVFIPRHGILLDDQLDPVKDVKARSILLHELVHYVQWRKANHQTAQNCHEWVSREDQAYAIQYRWLSKKNSAQQGYPSVRRRRVICTGPAPAAKTAKARKSQDIAANQ